MGNKLFLMAMSVVLAAMLAACSSNDTTTDGDSAEKGNDVTNNTQETDEQMTEEDEGEEHASHSSEMELPEGLKEAENPKFPVGSKATVNASHTDGMEGAEATIVAAYDTTVYSVSYVPTNGDPLEENHKWFVEGEIQGVDDATLDQGTEVIVEADHLPGMKGASGTIDTVEETTVYIVDYTNSLGETVKNHLWLKESELATK
ncbi:MULTISPECIES: YdhK family protein [Lysinibacillus]|uniref:DUF1541 domain-containing protein n=1 Tax=Lysinibacillus antri TaxID=2498145 RepID=A0A3S0R585_9BACI|nr:MULTISPECIES: YdhK family protein [Lysinibacillus]RUL50758.1 DUF1541 domain-containing protein [Lysinibacillus antri]TSI11751.1 DUF1541 domain-containing protein [Lysinibacillus sp. BW-2-10]